MNESTQNETHRENTCALVTANAAVVALAAVAARATQLLRQTQTCYMNEIGA